MTLIQTIQHSRRSRVFALLTLLLVLGLQSLEVVHNHTHDDGTVECLACKNSSAGAIAVVPPHSIATCGATAPLVEHVAQPLAARIRPYDSRGPPRFS